MTTADTLPQEPTAASTTTPAGVAARGSGRPQRSRQVRRPLHGVLLLDKPYGLSSNDALQRAKWLLRAEKAGHTGTLDPLATGLLPLCFGAATKFSQISLDADKRYLATLQMGVTTTTADAEGDVIETRPVDGITRARLEAVCAQLTGPIHQVPPMYSALKRDGKALYEYARAGIEREREARAQTNHAIDNVGAEHDRWTLHVHCSKGTYIRTLAEDIGRFLGCGAHLAGLRRTGSGALTLDGALTLEQLTSMSEAERDRPRWGPRAGWGGWALMRRVFRCGGGGAAHRCPIRRTCVCTGPSRARSWAVPTSLPAN